MEIEKTDEYQAWFLTLRDRMAKARINARLRKMELAGQIVGDFKVFGHVTELRFHFGLGYRLYATTKGRTFMLLLVGGDKSTQKQDIAAAQAMAEEWRKQK